MPRLRTGDVLIESGYITEEQLKEALDYQREHRNENKRVGRVLIDLGYVTEQQILESLSKDWDIPSSI